MTRTIFIAILACVAAAFLCACGGSDRDEQNQESCKQEATAAGVYVPTACADKHE